MTARSQRIDELFARGLSREQVARELRVGHRALIVAMSNARNDFGRDLPGAGSRRLEAHATTAVPEEKLLARRQRLSDLRTASRCKICRLLEPHICTRQRAD
jgi:hypothetical protein